MHKKKLYEIYLRICLLDTLDSSLQYSQTGNSARYTQYILISLCHSVSDTPYQWYQTRPAHYSPEEAHQPLLEKRRSSCLKNSLQTLLFTAFLTQRWWIEIYKEKRDGICIVASHKRVHKSYNVYNMFVRRVWGWYGEPW